MTGRGVTVALLDTGVADVPDLAGRIVPVRDDRTGRDEPCHDLSGEGSCRDSFGHGTFMAGLIAGAGAGGSAADRHGAGGARVLSVKVAGADGAADVSTVLAGLQWVVSFARPLRHRVVNLSLGTDSTQSVAGRPAQLRRAAGLGRRHRRGRRRGQHRPGARHDRQAGRRPVGRHRRRGRRQRHARHSATTASPTSPRAGRRGTASPSPTSSRRARGCASLRAPGSTHRPRSTRRRDLDSPYRSGSGTSMATALVSGAAALALQAHPEPDARTS